MLKISDLINLDDKQKAIILAGYAKRWMEKRHTNFFQTPLGKKIVAQGKAEKYIAEFLLYYISTFVDRKLPVRTIPQIVFKDVLMDAFPEFAKRMLNGDSREKAGKEVFTTNLCRRIEAEKKSPAKNSFIMFLENELQEIKDYFADRKRRKGL